MASAGYDFWKLDNAEDVALSKSGSTDDAEFDREQRARDVEAKYFRPVEADCDWKFYRGADGSDRAMVKIAAYVPLDESDEEIAQRIVDGLRSQIDRVQRRLDERAASRAEVKAKSL